MQNFDENLQDGCLHLLDEIRVSDASSSEAKRREAVVPPVSVFRWWARRTQAVVDAILAAYETTSNGQLVVADPFSGGGTVPLAALRRGHSVYAQDLNPWAVSGLTAMLCLPGPARIAEVHSILENGLQPLLQAAYGTRMSDGSDGTMMYAVRVACSPCSRCQSVARLFPHALVTLTSRKGTKGESGSALLACPVGHLWRTDEVIKQECPVCDRTTDPLVNYLARRIVFCDVCGLSERLQRRFNANCPEWELAFMERRARGRREFALPSDADIRQSDSFSIRDDVGPFGEIPFGPESQILHDFGFRYWKDLYTRRQRLVLHAALLSLNETDMSDHERDVYKLTVIGAAEMSAFLSRWDRWYLKPYEAMAGHRFNVTTLSTEPNVWGSYGGGRGTLTRRFKRLIRAAEWTGSELPAKVQITSQRSSQSCSPLSSESAVRIVQGSSERMTLTSDEVDLVLTDPPYHDDVNYADLAQMFLAWYGPVSDSPREAVPTIDHPTRHEDILQKVFTESARVLKPEGRLVLSYANRSPLAWVQLFRALESAGFYGCDYAIVHAENETDHTKRGRKACTLDLLLELTKRPTLCRSTHDRDTQLKANEMTDERSYLVMVAAQALRIGDLQTDVGWESRFEDSLSAHPFLTSNSNLEQSLATS